MKSSGLRPQAVNWLRYGCLPVGVVEGRAPPEKRALQQQRWVLNENL